MIEIIIDKDKIYNNFEYRKIGVITYLTPKNIDIFEYMKYMTKYATGKIIRNVNIFNSERYKSKQNFYKFLEESQLVSISISCHFSLHFEFPDDYPEEKLFYFRLKYC